MNLGNPLAFLTTNPSRKEGLMHDFATQKRLEWIKEAQQTSIVELLTFWDFLLVFILLQLILAILVLA